MSSPRPSRLMSKRRATQRKSLLVDSDEFFSDEEAPVPQARVTKRRGLTITDDEEEEFQDASEDENVAGPSTRRPKQSSKQKKAEPSEEEFVEVDEDEPIRPKPKKAAAKKGKRRSSAKPSQAEATPIVDSDGASDGDEVGEADDVDLLESAMSTYELASVPDSGMESNLSAGEAGRLVRRVMRFMLFRQMQKPDVPVRREEITKITLANYKGQKNSKLTTNILRLAAAKFPATFGMEMKEITLKSQTKHGEVDGAKVFLLRSLLPTQLRAFIKNPALDLNQGLAMVVLPLIALAGGKLSEADLSTQLEKLGINTAGVHPVLGKPADQIQELVNKRYLAKTRESGADGLQNVYAISSLVLDEIKEENMQAFIEKVFAAKLNT